ncbi:MAG: D-glycerate dehydrogenase [Pseudomonadota bacterium]
MAARPSVLVTRRWPDAVEARLAERYDATFNKADKPLSTHEIREAMGRYDAVLPTVTDAVCAETLAGPKQTKILANYGAGYSHIDIATAASQGITITNTPDVLSECTADLAMTLMLMVARRAGEGERELRNGAWEGWRPTHMVGTKVSGKVLGIVGFGRIGQEIAKRAHFGFGMEIIVQSRSAVPLDLLQHYGARQVASLNDLLPLCDFASLSCPGGPANRGLISGPELDLMKPGAFLINTARGEVVDEAALTQALMFDTIGGAALDVFDGEPRINPMLAQCDNLVMLPHLGSATREAREAMGFRVLDNLSDFFEGREPRDRVR